MTSKEKIIDAIVKNDGITSKQISEQTDISSKTVSNYLVKIINHSDIERKLVDGIFIYFSTTKPAKVKPTKKQRTLSRSQEIQIMYDDGMTIQEIIDSNPDWSSGHIRSAFYFAKKNPDKVLKAIKLKNEKTN